MDNGTSSLDTPTTTTTISSLSQTEWKVLLAAIMCLPEFKGDGKNAAPKANQSKRALKLKGPSKDNKAPRTGAKRVRRGDGGDVNA
ncbi:MAG: hypothetical protein Q9187_004707 [Circinaria calcarea]